MYALRARPKGSHLYDGSSLKFLFALKGSASGVLAGTGICPCNIHRTGRALFIFIVDTGTGLAVYLNGLAATAAAALIGKLTSLTKAGTACFICSRCLSSVYFNISFTAEIVCVVITGRCCTS